MNLDLEGLEKTCKAYLSVYENYYAKFDYKATQQYHMLDTVIQLIAEYKKQQKIIEELQDNKKTSKEEYICRKCGHDLDYHEWNCVLDGEETGETYKVIACEHCGQIEDIEEYKGILNLTEMRQMGKELKAWLNE